MNDNSDNSNENCMDTVNTFVNTFNDVNRSVSCNLPYLHPSDLNEKSSKINVVLLNARDLRTKLPDFHSEIFVNKNFPHIVGVTETWLTSSTPSSIFICI